MNIVNPATEVVIATLKEDDTLSLDQKMKLLRVAQPGWQSVSLGERIAILKQFAILLDTNKDNLAATLTNEVGKPLQQSINEINGAIARISWLTGNAGNYLSDEVMSSDVTMTEKIVYEPLGVICNISAWNYPYLVGVNVFVPALLAGNAVFYKPSEYTVLTGLHIQSLLKEAGVPEAVFQVAIGGAPVGDALLEMPIDGYYFTGSYKTGRYIYEKVAAKMVPCQCELGGKDPVYITGDVDDIASAAVATADGAFYNNGQSCCSVERIYVHEKNYDAYIDAFLHEVKSWKQGNPLEEGVYLGPVSRREQLVVLEEQVADALHKGAKLLTGGKRVEKTGYYFEPTVLTDVNHSMLLMQEESFGPVIGIMKVKDDEEALHLMQDNSYGLTAAVYSKNPEKAMQILSKIDAGSGYWNCCDRVSAALPWSGRKQSGFGATLSHVGLRAFTKPKSYHLRKP